MSASRKIRNRFVPLIALAIGVCFGVSGAQAETAASDWAEGDNSAVRLIAASATTGAGKAARLGLHFKMDKGWKIYWRTPGDAGFPPSLDNQGSENLAATDIQWPVPERFSILGFESFGYKDEVVLPVDATWEAAGRPAVVKARVDYLVCADICVPAEARLSLALDAGAPQPSDHAHLIDRFRALVPPAQTGAGPVATGLQVASVGLLDPQTLMVAARSDAAFGNPDLLVEGPEGIVFAKPEIVFDGSKTRADLKISVDAQYAKAPLRAGDILTVTLTDVDRGVEYAAPIQDRFTSALGGGTVPPASTGADLAPSFGLILLLAVAGGLILNLMPCVLPVLSIKLLGVVRHGGGDPGVVRISFLASAAGILAAFLILAGVLVAVKSAGAAIGWGIQFQHPAFLVALIVLLVLFAANMWDLFEFRLPRWAADGGEKSGRVQGLGGHFLTGMFATVLATPCSAPFLGTAVGFALARGPAEIFAVFTALGIGLALPYLVVSAMPRLATRLPKPGPWMVVLRKVLGLALVATAVWLVSIIYVQAGAVAALAVGFMMVLIVAFLAMTGAAADRPRMAGIALLVVAAFGSPAVFDNGGNVTVAAADDIWIAFDEAAIPGLISQGKTVFVDVTADWCLTCKANKKLVLSTAAVAARLAAPDVVAMKADWTKPDPVIAAYLAKFGRYGIPFNVVYGPQAPQGVTLPELLTTAAVQRAIVQAEDSDRVASSAGDTKIN